MEKQIKDLAWNTFKQTGNIDTFMELMRVVKKMDVREFVSVNLKIRLRRKGASSSSIKGFFLRSKRLGVYLHYFVVSWSFILRNVNVPSV